MKERKKGKNTKSHFYCCFYKSHKKKRTKVYLDDFTLRRLTGVVIVLSTSSIVVLFLTIGGTLKPSINGLTR